MKFSVIAPLGKNVDAIYLGIREFPTERIFLIHRGEDSEAVETFRKDLEKFRIEIQPIEAKGPMLEAMFRAFAKVKQQTEGERILVNVSSGDETSNCAALAAAFVNGLRAFHVEGDKVVMLPVLKFSYYRLIPERKLNILRLLVGQPDCCSSLEELSRRTGMSLPLVSYHVNGNSKAEGLISQGLVEVHVGPRGRTQVMLTELGRIIADGCAEGISKEQVPA